MSLFSTQSKHLAELFEMEGSKDVLLTCEDGQVRAHSFLLSMWSAYFRSLFAAGNAPSVVHLMGVDIADLLVVVNSVYFGTLPEQPSDSVMSIFRALLFPAIPDGNQPRDQSPDHPLRPQGVVNGNLIQLTPGDALDQEMAEDTPDGYSEGDSSRPKKRRRACFIKANAFLKTMAWFRSGGGDSLLANRGAPDGPRPDEEDQLTVQDNHQDDVEEAEVDDTESISSCLTQAITSASQRRRRRTMKCSECEKAYSSRSHLIDHQLVVHRRSKENYSCGICGQTTAWRESTVDHVRKCHPGKPPQDVLHELFNKAELRVATGPASSQAVTKSE